MSSIYKGTVKKFALTSPSAPTHSPRVTIFAENPTFRNYRDGSVSLRLHKTIYYSATYAIPGVLPTRHKNNSPKQEFRIVSRDAVSRYHFASVEATRCQSTSLLAFARTSRYYPRRAT